ncbi:MAG: ATP-binding protein, partial [Gemmatimonadales bacterium]|nr:ATP-binding protein [Gemmatimonadales bacterium]
MTEELNSRLTFDTLVVGAANRLAVTAARTVGESPGTAYNPLFIYGESGLGKTHLLTAIGHLARQMVADADVEYVTLDEFVEQYHAAVAAGQSEALRGRFGRVDVLLLDDVQFLTHRRELQAELLRIVELLQAANRQIVLTSDRPPAEIQDLDERLLSRFDGGLVVDMDAPDYETRLAILKRRVGERGVPVDPAVLEVVAGIQAHNVRELLGLLNRIVAYQAVSEVPITPEAAHQLLAGDAPIPKSSPAGGAITAPPRGDEFAEFLSGVTLAVHEQVGVWRSRITECIKRWGGEGYRTIRLEQLLKQEVPTGIERVIREYERDVDRLRGFQRAMARVDPHRVSDPIFFDPERLEEADALVQSALREGRPPPGPSPAWMLDALVPGASNKVALNAANAVIASPGAAYNPLVLIGPPGVGKTHLLHAIGNQLAGDPNPRVACLSAQEFVDELLDAIDGDRVEAWRKRYRGATAVLLDDVHLLAGKERSQEELFHLYNTLLAEDRQLIFTLVDRPGAIEGLDRRLVTRLEGGLVAALDEPDPEVRRGVIFRRLKAKDREVDPELAEYLTARPAESVRAVINVVQRVLRAA